MSPKSPRSPKHGGYRSGFELNIAKFLKSRGIKFKYEPDILPYYQPVRNGKCTRCLASHVGDVVKRREYTPDFRIGLTYLEGKGKFTSADRSKFIAVKESNASQDIRFVFMRDNYLRKGSKTKYSQWATANGYPWCIGPDLPKEWVEELCVNSVYIEPKSSVTVGVKTSTPSSLPPTHLTKPSTSHVAGITKRTTVTRLVKSSHSRSLKRSASRASSLTKGKR